MPTLRFRSIEQKNQNVLAKCIPDLVWGRNFSGARGGLTDLEQDLMKMETESLSAHLATIPTQIQTLSSYAKDQIKLWLAIALSHPDCSDEQLMQLAMQLNIKPADILVCAVSLGKMRFFEHVVKQFEKNLQDLIQTKDYRVFRRAAWLDHIEIMKRLIALVPPATHEKMVMANYCSAFRASAFHDIAMMEYLITLAPKQITALFLANNSYAFSIMAAYGCLDKMQLVLKLAPKDIHQEIIAADDFSAFNDASYNGHLEVMEYLIKLAPARAQEMIAANNYAAFIYAASNGHLEILDYLIKLAPDKIQEMIASENFSAFIRAA